jgi:hypothetical protein
MAATTYLSQPASLTIGGVQLADDDFEGFIDELVDIEQVEGDEPRDANPTDGGQ